MRVISSSHVLLAVVLQNVPTELWDYIFRLATGSVWVRGDPAEYMWTRDAIFDTCGRWREVLAGNANFWYRIHVEMHTRPQSVTRALSMTADHAIVARMILYADGLFPPAAFFAAIQPKFHNLVILTVDFKDRTSFLQSQRLFSNIHMPRLQHLDLAVTQDPMRPGGVGLAPLYIPHSLSAVKRIYLGGLCFDFTAVHAFTNLSVCVLRDFLPLHYPTFFAYSLLATGAPRLQQLCLHNIGCLDLPSQDTPDITFPHVHNLHLKFDHARISMVAFLLRVQFPAMRCLGFEGDSLEDIEALNICGHVLAKIQVFEYDGRDPDDMALAHIFSCVPLLRRLHILHGDRNVFQALLLADSMASAQQTAPAYACPSLSTLGSSFASVTDVRDFLTERGVSSPTLTHLIFHRGYHCHLEDPALIWLKSATRVSAYRYSNADWLHWYW
ncbi:hypothetical protein C8R43DRAFT_1136137 [Mycena crocata]|nr:hypothetical protein C8R43DRAFT_1136137 [Mycena crocata]